MSKRPTAPTCQKPDRHEPALVCGYPLPCPHHTDATVEVEPGAVVVTTTGALSPRARQVLTQAGKALGHAVQPPAGKVWCGNCEGFGKLYDQDGTGRPPISCPVCRGSKHVDAQGTGPRLDETARRRLAAVGRAVAPKGNGAGSEGRSGPKGEPGRVVATDELSEFDAAGAMQHGTGTPGTSPGPFLPEGSMRCSGVGEAMAEAIASVADGEPPKPCPTCGAAYGHTVYCGALALREHTRCRCVPPEGCSVGGRHGTHSHTPNETREHEREARVESAIGQTWRCVECGLVRPSSLWLAFGHCPARHLPATRCKCAVFECVEVPK